eukprot:scaffold57813_cov19-Tisochrysis_lutea.AAC.1
MEERLFLVKAAGIYDRGSIGLCVQVRKSKGSFAPSFATSLCQVFNGAHTWDVSAAVDKGHSGHRRDVRICHHFMAFACPSVLLSKKNHQNPPVPLLGSCLALRIVMRGIIPSSAKPGYLGTLVLMWTACQILAAVVSVPTWRILAMDAHLCSSMPTVSNICLPLWPSREFILPPYEFVLHKDAQHLRQCGKAVRTSLIPFLSRPYDSKHFMQCWPCAYAHSEVLESFLCQSSFFYPAPFGELTLQPCLSSPALGSFQTLPPASIAQVKLLLLTSSVICAGQPLPLRYTAACSRSLVLKPCLQLPTPLWREAFVIGLRGNPSSMLQQHRASPALALCSTFFSVFAFERKERLADHKLAACASPALALRMHHRPRMLAGRPSDLGLCSCSWVASSLKWHKMRMKGTKSQGSDGPLACRFEKYIVK